MNINLDSHPRGGYHKNGKVRIRVEFSTNIIQPMPTGKKTLHNDSRRARESHIDKWTFTLADRNPLCGPWRPLPPAPAILAQLFLSKLPESSLRQHHPENFPVSLELGAGRWGPLWNFFTRFGERPSPHGRWPLSSPTLTICRLGEAPGNEGQGAARSLRSRTNKENQRAWMNAALPCAHPASSRARPRGRCLASR